MGGSAMNYEVAADGLAEEQVSRLETVLLEEYEVTVLDNEDAGSCVLSGDLCHTGRSRRRGF